MATHRIGRDESKIVKLVMNTEFELNFGGVQTLMNHKKFFQ